MIVLPKKRRLQGKTNYVKRRILLEGRKPRIVIRKSNRYITLQYVESKLAQDSVKASAISKELTKYGWPKERAGSLKSLAASYMTGLLFGKRIKSKELKPAILDTGLIRSTRGSKIYSAIKGITDSGAKVKCNPEVFPDTGRINTEKTKNFFDKVKNKIMEGK